MIRINGMIKQMFTLSRSWRTRTGAWVAGIRATWRWCLSIGGSTRVGTGLALSTVRDISLWIRHSTSRIASLKYVDKNM